MTALHPLLVLHSLCRWLVLISLVYSSSRAYAGWLRRRRFSTFDDMVRHTTATIAHVQLLLGLSLYFISPLVRYFLQNFGTAVHQRQVRFFGMEHSFVMLLAITVLTVGSAKARHKTTDVAKHKTVAIWYTAALLLILSSIPWAFSPLVSRPWIRWF